MLLQVNTSAEDSKSGLSALDGELANLAKHIIDECPRLRLQGLMTIGSIDQSHSGDENQDFETLKRTRDALQATLAPGNWGVDGVLVLSMGMSSDFEAALKAGSDIVRVGTGIFGSRPPKEIIREFPFLVVLDIAQIYAE